MLLHVKFDARHLEVVLSVFVDGKDGTVRDLEEKVGCPNLAQSKRPSRAPPHLVSQLGAVAEVRGLPLLLFILLPVVGQEVREPGREGRHFRGRPVVFRHARGLSPGLAAHVVRVRAQLDVDLVVRPLGPHLEDRLFDGVVVIGV